MDDKKGTHMQERHIPSTVKKAVCCLKGTYLKKSVFKLMFRFTILSNGIVMLQENSAGEKVDRILLIFNP